MPIFNPARPTTPPPTTKIEPEISVSQVYETREYKSPLITEIEGEPWVVQYYHQMLVSGESPQSLDANLSATLQQYLRVTDFRLSVTDELSYSQDTATQLSELTGSGLIYPDTVAPHIGDMFVGFIEAGRRGLFTLTSVQALGYYKRTVYQVEYRLFSEESAPLLANLDSKVVQYRYFDARRLKAGYSPLIEYSVANSERNFLKDARRLMDRLYSHYFSPRLKTFVVEHLGETYYDPWLVNFFNAVIPHTLRGHYPIAEEYSIGETMEYMDRPTLWTAILKRDTYILEHMPRTYVNRGAGTFSGYSMYHSILNVGIDYVTMPNDWTDSTVHPDTEPYLFTHALYDVDGDKSEIEMGVAEYVETGTISNQRLAMLVETALSSEGMSGLRESVLALALLRFKIVGV